MYSRKRAEAICDDLPGQIPYQYGGTRFSRNLRSDGREEIFDKGFLPLEKGDRSEADGALWGHGEGEAPQCVQGEGNCAEKTSRAGADLCAEATCASSSEGHFASFFSHFGNDDLILTALILFLAGEGEENKGAILILLYLLACG